jgi:hypothetical protein
LKGIFTKVFATSGKRNAKRRPSSISILTRE